MRLSEAILSTMGKQGKFPRPGDPEVATAVRNAEKRIAEGECLKLAVAHAVGEANISFTKARLISRVN